MLRTMKQTPVLVFDLDDTLWFYGYCVGKGKPCIVLYPMVRKLIEELAGRYILAIASYHRGGQEILNRLGLTNYFTMIKCEPHKQWKKHTYLLEIAKSMGVSPSSVILFDDKKENISLARSVGASAIQVDPQTGLTTNNVRMALTNQRIH